MTKPKHTPTREPLSALMLPLGIVALGAIFAFASSFAGTYVLDDMRTIVKNPQLQSFEHIFELLAHSRRPVVDFTLAISASMAGSWNTPNPPEPSAFHALNLLVHLLAALTLFDLIRRLALKANTNARLATWGACAVALLWAVHPLQTESVTYIIQRAESLAGLFYLLTLWCVVRCAESTGRARAVFAVLAVLASALSMGSKGVAVTIPLTALLMDRAFLAGSFVGALRARWPVYLGLVASLSVLALTGVAQGVLGTKENPVHATVGFLYEGITPTAYFLTQPAVILHYLRLTFLPVGQCLDYAWQPAESLAAALPTLIPLALAGLATLWGLTKNTWWGFVGAWFFIILAPTSSFIPIKDLAFEHRMYLPLAAPLALASVGVIALVRRFVPNRSNMITPVLAGAVAIALIVLTINRNAVYQSDLRMWADITAKAPHNARAWSNLGMNASTSKPPQNELAERAFRNAIEADPDLAAPYINLANVLVRTARPVEAIERYETFENLLLSGETRLWNRQAQTIATCASTRGRLLMQIDRAEEAEPAFARAVEHAPDRPDLRVLLANTLAKLDRLDEAKLQADIALKLDPNSETAKRTLGLIRRLRRNR